MDKPRRKKKIRVSRKGCSPQVPRDGATVSIQSYVRSFDQLNGLKSGCTLVGGVLC